MENLEIAVEKLNEAKVRYAELLANKARLESESVRLQTLLQATESEVDACIKERREFIEGGGDVFEPHAKKLRKQELENASLIDDLRFACDTNRKAADEMMFKVSAAHDSLEGSHRVYAKALESELIEAVRNNPPVELLKACHLATHAHFTEGFSFFLATIAVAEKPTYEAAFVKKMGELLCNSLYEFSKPEYCKALFSEEEAALLRVPVLRGKITPAQAHYIRASKNQRIKKTTLPALYKMHPELLGRDEIDARSRNLEAI